MAPRLGGFVGWGPGLCERTERRARLRISLDDRAAGTSNCRVQLETVREERTEEQTLGGITSDSVASPKILRGSGGATRRDREDSRPGRRSARFLCVDLLLLLLSAVVPHAQKGERTRGREASDDGEEERKEKYG